MSAVIEVRDVSYAYNREYVLQGINLVVEKGEFLGIIGPNAGGKSTLIKLILGLLEPREGEIIVMGHSVIAARRYLGYVPQYPTFSRRDFPINVRDAVMLGRLGLTAWYLTNRLIIRRSVAADADCPRPGVRTGDTHTR